MSTTVWTQQSLPSNNIITLNSIESITIHKNTLETNTTNIQHDITLLSYKDNNNDIESEILTETSNHDDSCPLDGHLASFLGLQENKSVPILQWTNEEQIELKQSGIKKRRRKRGIPDKERAAILTTLTDFFKYCQNKALSQIHNESSNILLEEDYETIFYKRCTSPSEYEMMKSMFTLGNPEPILNDLIGFIRIFIPSRFIDSIEFLLPHVQRLLTLYRQNITTSDPFDKKNTSITTKMNRTECPQCGSDDRCFIEQSDTTQICEQCGYVVNETSLWEVSASSIHELTNTDYAAAELFSEGRQFVETNGLFAHLASSGISRQRLKASVMERIIEICSELDIKDEPDIQSVARLLSRYALNPISVRLRSTIAGCAYLIMRQNGHMLTLAEIAKKTNLHVATLASRVFRICIVTGIVDLPQLSRKEAIIRAINKVLNAATCDTSNNSSLSVEETCNHVYENHINTSAPPCFSQQSLFLNKDDLSDWFERSNNNDDTQASSHQERIAFSKEESETNTVSPIISSSLLNDILLEDSPASSFDEQQFTSNLFESDATDNNLLDLFDNNENTEVPKKRKLISFGLKQKRHMKQIGDMLQPIRILTEQLVAIFDVAKKFDYTRNQGLISDVHLGKSNNGEKKSKKQDIRGHGVITERLNCFRVECFPSFLLYDIGCALYYATMYSGIDLSPSFISNVLNLNEGTYGRVRRQFLEALRQLLAATSLIEMTRFSKLKSKTGAAARAIVGLIEQNYDLLLHYGDGCTSS